MYYNLTEYNNIFVRPQRSKLLMVIPLCARTVIFFCDDLTFYHYSLIDNKILYQSKLPGRPVSAIALSGHCIVCTIVDTRSLMVLNLEEKSFEFVCQLPQTKVHNERKEKDIFTQTKLHIFEKGGSFYIEQPRSEENRTKIYVYHKNNQSEKITIKLQDLVTKEINTRKMVLKKLDSESRLVLFKQEIQDNGIFKFTTIDTKDKDLVSYDFACENQAFSRFAIVKQIRAITNDTQSGHPQMLIFINCSGPQILLFSNHEAKQYPYKSRKMFMSTILINVQLGFGMFMFLPPAQEPNSNYDYVIELISLKSGAVLDKKKVILHDIVKSWEDDYFLLYKREIQPSYSSNFQIQSIVSKNSFYLKMMLEKGYEDLPPNFVQEVINCFQQ